AAHGQMPQSALDNVPVDHRASLSEIAPLIVSLSRSNSSSRPSTMQRFPMHTENTNLTCPDCHGPLYVRKFGKLTELRCRVGHSYSPENALIAHDEAEERVLWSAIESLEEGADLAKQLAHDLPSELKTDFKERIRNKRVLAKRLREAAN